MTEDQNTTLKRSASLVRRFSLAAIVTLGAADIYLYTNEFSVNECGTSWLKLRQQLCELNLSNGETFIVKEDGAKHRLLKTVDDLRTKKIPSLFQEPLPLEESDKILLRHDMG